MNRRKGELHVYPMLHKASVPSLNAVLISEHGPVDGLLEERLEFTNQV